MGSTLQLDRFAIDHQQSFINVSFAEADFARQSFNFSPVARNYGLQRIQNRMLRIPLLRIRNR